MEGQHHVWNYNERLHHLLATIFRVGPGQTILRASEFRSTIFIQLVPLARLLQQPTEPYHLRGLEQRPQETLPRDAVLTLY